MALTAASQPGPVEQTVNTKLGATYKGPSGYNQPLSNTFTVIWEIPSGKGKRFGGSMPGIADHVVEGWNISQTTTANSR